MHHDGAGPTRAAPSVERRGLRTTTSPTMPAPDPRLLRISGPALQRAVGNRAVTGLVGGGPIAVQRDVLIGLDEVHSEESIFAALIARDEWRDLPEDLVGLSAVRKQIQGQVVSFARDGERFEHWADLVGSLRFLVVGADAYGDRKSVFEEAAKVDSSLERHRIGAYGRIERWLKEHRAFRVWADVVKALSPGPVSPAAATTVKIGDQMYTLVGTTHGAYGQDLSDTVPANARSNADLILEYPPLGEGRDTYTPGDIGKVWDKTQTTLANQASGQGMTVVGADGRKVQTEPGEHIGLSIRNRVGGFSVTDKEIATEDVTAAVNTYLDACIGQADLPSVFMDPMNTWVTYTAPTDLQRVLAQTAARVRTLSQHVDHPTVDAIGRRVLAVLKRELDIVVEHHEKASEGRQRLNTELVSAALDAVCNLLLFTQTLASTKESVIVAFGAEHVKPLAELLEEVRALRAKEQHGTGSEKPGND